MEAKLKDCHDGFDYVKKIKDNNENVCHSNYLWISIIFLIILNFVTCLIFLYRKSRKTVETFKIADETPTVRELEPIYTEPQDRLSNAAMYSNMENIH